MAKLPKQLNKKVLEQLEKWDEIMLKSPELVRGAKEAGSDIANKLANQEKEIARGLQREKEILLLPEAKGESVGGNIVPDQKGRSLLNMSRTPDEVIPPETGLVKSRKLGPIQDAEISEPRKLLPKAPEQSQDVAAIAPEPNAASKDKKRSLIRPALTTAGVAGGIGAGLGLMGSGPKAEPKPISDNTAQEKEGEGQDVQQLAKEAGKPTADSKTIKAAVQAVQSQATKSLGSAGSQAGDSGAPAGLKEYKAQDFSDSLNNLKEMAANLPKREKKDFDKLLADLRQRYEQDKASLERRELGEKLAHAFTQIAAGIYGLNTGMNLSGLKFDKTDWASKANMAVKEYDMERDFLSKELDKQDKLAQTDQEFLQSLGKERTDLLQKQAAGEVEAENKGISDFNKSLMSREEDARRAARDAQEQGFRAGESQKDRETRERIAKLGAETRERVAGTRASGSSGTPSARVPAASKAQIDKAVEKRLSLIDSTLKSIASKKTGSQKTEAASAALSAVGYSPEQIKTIKDKNRWGDGKDDADYLTEELAAARQREESKLYKNSRQESSAPAKVTVQGPSGETAEITAEAWANKYSKMPGYKRVD